MRRYTKLTLTTASILGLSLLNLSSKNIQARAAIAPKKEVATVRYNGKGQVRLLDANGHYQNQYVPNGARYKVFGAKEINGQIMFRLGSQKQYIPAKFVDINAVQVSYNGKGGVNLLNTNGKYQNVYVANGQKYRVFEVKTINGRVMYRIGTQSQWIPSEFARLISTPGKPADNVIEIATKNTKSDTQSAASVVNTPASTAPAVNTPSSAPASQASTAPVVPSQAPASSSANVPSQAPASSSAAVPSQAPASSSASQGSTATPSQAPASSSAATPSQAPTSQGSTAQSSAAVPSQAPASSSANVPSQAPASSSASQGSTAIPSQAPSSSASNASSAAPESSAASQASASSAAPEKQTALYTITYTDNGKVVGTQMLEGKVGDTVVFNVNVPEGYQVVGAAPTSVKFISARHTMTIPVSSVNQAYNYKTDIRIEDPAAYDKAVQQYEKDNVMTPYLKQVSQDGMADNPAIDPLKDQRPLDLMAMTDDQKQELSRYAIDVVNSVRKAVGVPEWHYDQNIQKLADDVARRYNEDNWSVNDPGHDTKALTLAARENGMPKYGKDNNGNDHYVNYYEDEAGFEVADPHNYTMGAAKANIYWNAKQMFFGGSDNADGSDAHEMNHAYDLTRHTLDSSPAALSISVLPDGDYSFLCSTHFVSPTNFLISSNK